VRGSRDSFAEPASTGCSADFRLCPIESCATILGIDFVVNCNQQSGPDEKVPAVIDQDNSYTPVPKGREMQIEIGGVGSLDPTVWDPMGKPGKPWGDADE